MKKVIIYGAGTFGKELLGFLRYKSYDGVVCFADKNAKEIAKIDGIPVKSVEDCLKLNVPFLVAIRNEEIKQSIYNDILLKGGSVYEDIDSWVVDSGLDVTKWHRDYVAYVHIEIMDDYYTIAENEEHLNIFWSEKSVFYELFNTLDLTCVVELACGHGRHVPKYMDRAKKIILVDILKENIDYCSRRFKDQNNISYYRNNGFDLREISDNSVTALFSYDAMVHFEMMDIYEYLKDIYRILSQNGRALLHHSNRYRDPLAEAFENSAHSRNFMSKELLAYMSHRVGLFVVEQRVIPWGGVDELDCVTLLEKR